MGVCDIFRRCLSRIIHQVREGQKIKSEVQLSTEDFILVLLKGHAAGQFAYLPAKRVCEQSLFVGFACKCRKQ